MSKNYLKISRASDLAGRERKLYRLLEILPGFLSWITLLTLLIMSYLKPVWVAYFLITFDVYWLLLVIFLGLHLLASYGKMQANLKKDWPALCLKQPGWQEIIHLIILPTYNESETVISQSLQALLNDGYPVDKMIVALATEGRSGEQGRERARQIERAFGHRFRNFLVTVHPDNIAGEIKGKGSNQAWAARQVKRLIIDREKLDYDKILVSVFDIDTAVYQGYFYCLTYNFLTATNPYRASYKPIPVYHNNIWQAPFFARVAAYSNTFWQMMQQIRQEKLATYSSHSLTWRALIDIDFWSTNMVSEDSRIFWHCFLHYNGDYRVEPLYFPVSMDVCMDETRWKTIKNLYRQQQRWGYGVENIPYLIFNSIKKWRQLPKTKTSNRILVQLYGFHSWATNALIIAVIGWMPLILGGGRFNATVLSGNLPVITRSLMTLAMIGLVLSAIISTQLLPKRPPGHGLGKNIVMVLQWLILPVTIIVFGAIPGLQAQTRLLLGKYLGFWVTPKAR